MICGCGISLSRSFVFEKMLFLKKKKRCFHFRVWFPLHIIKLKLVKQVEDLKFEPDVGSNVALSNTYKYPGMVVLTAWFLSSVLSRIVCHPQLSLLNHLEQI